MSEIPKAYEPQSVESKWYQFWLGHQCFVADAHSKKPAYSIIIQQLKKLGCSCDWSRERFTADPDYSRCVQKVFVELYKKGLIYRGKRMVNWCPASLTALSDEEVVMKAQSGLLHYFKVEVVEIVGQASRLSQTEKEKNENAGRQDACPTNNEIRATGIWLTIATTRPETIP